MNHTPQPTTGKHPNPTAKNDHISVSVHDLNGIKDNLLDLQDFLDDLFSLFVIIAKDDTAPNHIKALARSAQTSTDAWGYINQVTILNLDRYLDRTERRYLGV